MLYKINTPVRTFSLESKNRKNALDQCIDYWVFLDETDILIWNISSVSMCVRVSA